MSIAQLETFCSEMSLVEDRTRVFQFDELDAGGLR